MDNVVLLTTCKTCEGTRVLRDAAIDAGYSVKVEQVVRSDVRTSGAVESGFGLPVLVREDGGFSDDGVNWVGGKAKRRTRKIHPVDEVIVPVDNVVESGDNVGYDSVD
jgi:hypothetical protein